MTDEVPAQLALLVGSEGLDPGEVIELYVAVGWGTGEDYVFRAVETALRNTTCVIAVRDGDGSLVGLTRLLSDGAIHTALIEMVVHPSHQGGRVGMIMLAEVIARYGATNIFFETFGGKLAGLARYGFRVREDMVVVSRAPRPG